MYHRAQKLKRILHRYGLELLGVEGIGIDDSFFELGGHSLLALQMLKAINKNFGVKFSIVDLFEFSTVKKLSDKIEPDINQDHFRSNPIERLNRKKNAKIHFKRYMKLGVKMTDNTNRVAVIGFSGAFPGADLAYHL